MKRFLMSLIFIIVIVFIFENHVLASNVNLSTTPNVAKTTPTSQTSNSIGNSPKPTNTTSSLPISYISTPNNLITNPNSSNELGGYSGNKNSEVLNSGSSVRKCKCNFICCY